MSTCQSCPSIWILYDWTSGLLASDTRPTRPQDQQDQQDHKTTRPHRIQGTRNNNKVRSIPSKTRNIHVNHKKR